MTTSGRSGKPVGQHSAEADTSPSADLLPDATTAARTSETATPADAGAAAPDDAQQLQQEIERTREQLGETVEKLAAKADVKARARDKAVEFSGRVKSKAGQARKEAAARSESARSQLAGKAAAARQQATSAGGARKDELQTRAAVAMPVWEATPEHLRRAVAKGASTARQRRVPLAAAAVALILGYLAIRRWRRQ